MSTIIETLSGVKYVLDDLGIRTIEFMPNSPDNINYTEKLDDGRILMMGSEYGLRTISATFKFNGQDLYDFNLYVHEVFKLFNGLTDFYLINSIDGTNRRWRVRTDGSYTPSRTLYNGTIDVSFICTTGLSESVGTTLDPWTFTVGKWQVGQGLILEETQPSYSHSTNTFRIYNGSDVSIDPRMLPLLIKYQGSSSNLNIKNNTTNDLWTYDGDSSANDTISLNGVRSTKNGLTIFSKTNRKLITLAKGWNEFTLTGTSGTFLISFDFRFYTL